MSDDENPVGDFYILNPDGSSQHLGSAADVSTEGIDPSSERDSRMYELLRQYADPAFCIRDLDYAIEEAANKGKKRTVKNTQRIIVIDKE